MSLTRVDNIPQPKAISVSVDSNASAKLTQKLTSNAIYPAKLIDGTTHSPKLELVGEKIAITTEAAKQMLLQAKGEIIYVKPTLTKGTLQLVAFADTKPSQIATNQINQQQIPQTWQKLAAAIVGQAVKQITSYTETAKQVALPVSITSNGTQWQLTTGKANEQINIGKNLYPKLAEGTAHINVLANSDGLQIKLVTANKQMTNIDLNHLPLNKIWQQIKQQLTSSPQMPLAKSIISVDSSGNQTIKIDALANKFPVPKINSLPREQVVYLGLKSTPSIEVFPSQGKLPLNITMANNLPKNLSGNNNNQATLVPSDVLTTTTAKFTYDRKVLQQSISQQSPNAIEKPIQKPQQLADKTPSLTGSLSPKDIATKSSLPPNQQTTVAANIVTQTSDNSATLKTKLAELTGMVKQAIDSNKASITNSTHLERATKNIDIPAPVSVKKNNDISQLTEVAKSLPKVSSQLLNEVNTITTAKDSVAVQRPLADKFDLTLSAIKTMINDTNKTGVSNVEVISVLKSVVNQLTPADKQQFMQLIESTLLSQVQQPTASAFTPVINKTSVLGSIASALTVLLGAKQVSQSNAGFRSISTQSLTPLLVQFGLISPRNTTSDNTKAVLAKISRSEQFSAAAKQLGSLIETFQQAKVALPESTSTQSTNLYLVIPLMLDQDTKTLELIIKQEKQNDDNDNSKAKAWQLTLKLNVGDLGNLLAKVTLEEKKLTMDFIAESDELATKTNAHLTQFETQMLELGFSTQSFTCSRGDVPDSLKTASVSGIYV